MNTLVSAAGPAAIEASFHAIAPAGKHKHADAGAAGERICGGLPRSA